MTYDWGSNFGGETKKWSPKKQTCRPSCSEQPSSKPVSKWASTDIPQSPRVPNGVPNGGLLVISVKPTTKLAFWRIKRSHCTQKTPKETRNRHQKFPYTSLEVSRLCKVLMKSWPGPDLQKPGGPGENFAADPLNDHRLVDRGPTQLIDDLLLDATIQTSVAGVAAAVLLFMVITFREVGLGKKWGLGSPEQRTPGWEFQNRTY